MCLSGALQNVSSWTEIMHTAASINKTCTWLTEDGSARSVRVMLLSVTAAARTYHGLGGNDAVAFPVDDLLDNWHVLGEEGREEGWRQAQARHLGIYVISLRLGSKPEVGRETKVRKQPTGRGDNDT